MHLNNDKQPYNSIWLLYLHMYQLQLLYGSSYDFSCLVFKFVHIHTSRYIDYIIPKAS